MSGDPAPAHPALGALITRIETFPLRVELERPATGATLNLTHRCTIVTRVHTDAGVVGECFLGNDDVLQPAIVTMIHDELEPLLVGKPAAAVEDAWRTTRVATKPFLRDRRVALRAQACVDAALHDALGKFAGLPISVLWGGAKPSIPVFALGGYYREHTDLEALRDEVHELQEFGIGGLKVKVGGQTPRQDAARVAAVREAGGPGFLVAADANQNWTRQEALEFARITRDLDLAWFEEPCTWDNDRRDLAFIRGTGTVPVAAGQSELSRFGCLDLLAAGAVDYCNFDAYWGGGPTEWRRTAALASGFGAVPLQHLEPQIGPMMAAGTAESRIAEVLPPWRDPFFYRLIGTMPERPFKDGEYHLPAGPGWGMELDEDYLEFAARGVE